MSDEHDINETEPEDSEDFNPADPGSVEPDTDDEPVGGGNVIADIRARREELQEEHHLILPVPGYEGLLGVRYNNVGSDVTERIGKRLRKELKARKGEGQTLLGSVDTLISACDLVVVKDPGHPKCIRDDDGEPTDWRPIDTNSLTPVRFDRRLANILQFEASSAREVVLGLFNNEHAVIQQNIQLSRWLVDSTREVDEDLLGE